MSLTVKHVFDEKDLKDIYRLRYKIYCYEWGFEKPENHPGEIVTDVYDNNALHFAVKDDAQKTVGAISLILHSPEGFPTEKYCELNLDRDEMSSDSIAEISRLVIHRDYRRRTEDKYIYGPDEERRSIGSYNYSSNYSNNRSFIRRADDKYKYKGAKRQSEPYSERRKRHEVVINLYKAVYRESKRRKITHWYAVMTKGIVILLNKFGFIFKEIGDPVDYHGIRTPYLGDIAKIEKVIMEEHPDLYEELNKDL
ncbi:MAG: GNAT family N-acetyltransferase [Nitrospirae bacterium]|nr:GNAT family N-acetyltransferase [Nitrospirota bacterium]